MVELTVTTVRSGGFALVRVCFTQVSTCAHDLTDGDTLGYEYEEWVLPPDTAIFVQGEASDRDGALQVAKPEG
jgi:E3 Ubiquitin ligase